MERIIIGAMIALTLAGGYAITSGMKGASTVAQAEQAPAVILAKVEASDPLPVDRPAGHTAYVDQCRKDGMAARAASPEMKFRPNDTVAALCDCLLDTMVEEGVTEGEIAVLSQENMVFAQAYQNDDPNEALRKMIESEKRLDAKLGKERHQEIMQKGMKAMRCPGLLPANMKELMAR